MSHPSAAQYSAAICRGLIEADTIFTREHVETLVFRGDMPRPH